MLRPPILGMKAHVIGLSAACFDAIIAAVAAGKE